MQRADPAFLLTFGEGLSTRSVNVGNVFCVCVCVGWKCVFVMWYCDFAGILRIMKEQCLCLQDGKKDDEVAVPVCAQEHERYYPTPPHPTPPVSDHE